MDSRPTLRKGIFVINRLIGEIVFVNTFLLVH